MVCGREYGVLDNQVWRAFDPGVTNGNGTGVEECKW